VTSFPRRANAAGAARAFLGTQHCIPPHDQSGGCAPPVARHSSAPVVLDRETGTALLARDMMRLEWNALHVGDKVLVHDPTDPEMALLAGTVSMVDTATRSKDLGINVAHKGDRARVLRPNRLTVHLDPLDGTEDCWRCDAAIAGGDHGRDTARVGAP
jgi:hypothetical protein